MTDLGTNGHRNGGGNGNGNGNGRYSDDQHWHLDRRVPLALFLAILAQTFAAAWFIVGLHYRVIALESGENKNGDLRERIIRVEQAAKSNGAALDRIEKTLDRLQFSKLRYRENIEPFTAPNLGRGRGK